MFIAAQSGHKTCLRSPKSRCCSRNSASLDEALSWARHVEQGGRVPLLIEGDDGTKMDKRAIADALRVGAREEVGK